MIIRDHLESLTEGAEVVDENGNAPDFMPFPWIHGRTLTYDNGVEACWYNAPGKRGTIETRLRVYSPWTGTVRDEVV